MLLPNRHANTSDYRYGFQGQELDNEIKGEGNSINYKYRMHDPRVGRFFAVDPMVHAYPWYTPYQFSGNTPVMSTELEGLEPIVEHGRLVGYTIIAGQGPTQVAGDLNDPKTQEKYGYSLIKPVDWTDIVKQNYSYFKEAGAWGNSDMLDANNPVYRNLNSNEKDKITLVFSEEATVSSVIKPISDDLVGLKTPDASSSDDNFWDDKGGLRLSDGGESTQGIVSTRGGSDGSSSFDFNGVLSLLQSIIGRGRAKGSGPSSKGRPSKISSATSNASSAIQKLTDQAEINVPNEWKKVRLNEYDTSDSFEIIDFRSKNFHNDYNGVGWIDGKNQVIFFSTAPSLEEAERKADSLVENRDKVQGYQTDSTRVRKRGN